MSHHSLRNSFSFKNIPIRAILLGLFLSYVGIFVITRIYAHFTTIYPTVDALPYWEGTRSLYIFSFLLLFGPLSYLFNCWLCSTWIRPNINRLIMYMGMVFLVAIVFEISLNRLFIYFMGRPSWIYQIWPVYQGSTSGIMTIIWPWYGFHLYFFHQALKLRKSRLYSSGWAIAAFTVIDAMSLETIVNLFSLVFFKQYLFFYLRPDLHHFTSLEIFIPYFITGIILVFAIHIFDRDRIPKRSLGIAAYLLGIFIVLVLG